MNWLKMNDISVYHYSGNDFIFKTQWSEDKYSSFDQDLIYKWKSMQESGSCFKYKLKIDKSKIVPGKYRYLAQLNLNRALLRRKPAEMQSMKQQFDPNSFNFTKMDKKEILFELRNKDRKTAKGNYLVINVSPLEFGHCLLLPALFDSLPQVVTFESLLDAVEVFLLSNSPAMRMGFNGLCAHASLNHLHFHLYYLDQQMPLETIEVEHLAGPCYILQNFPSQGFVFQLTNGQDMDHFVRDVFKLVSFLQEMEKPHNIFITRASSFQDKSPGSCRNHVRVYIWTRNPVYGAKEVSAFQPALCEMFGHLLIKKTEDYENLTEDFVAEILSDLTNEPFQSVVNEIRTLFEVL